MQGRSRSTNKGWEEWSPSSNIKLDKSSPKMTARNNVVTTNILTCFQAFIQNVVAGGVTGEQGSPPLT